MRGSQLDRCSVRGSGRVGVRVGVLVVFEMLVFVVFDFEGFGRFGGRAELISSRLWNAVLKESVWVVVWEPFHCAERRVRAAWTVL